MATQTNERPVMLPNVCPNQRALVLLALIGSSCLMCMGPAGVRDAEPKQEQRGWLGWLGAPKQVKGSGRSKEERRALSGFTRLAISGALRVDVRGGKPFDTRLTGDDNLLAFIKTEVKGETLHIHPQENTNLSPQAELNVVVSLPHINGLEISGASSVGAMDFSTSAGDIDVSGASQLTLKGIRTHNLKLDASGASIVQLVGEVARFDVEVSGASRLDAKHLKAAEITVEASGAANADVSAHAGVTGEASGASDLSVWGNPARLAVEASGAASVTRKQ